MLNNNSQIPSLSSVTPSSINRRICSSADPGCTRQLSAIITERGLCESLLEVDDEFGEDDCNFPQTVQFDVADSIFPWQDVAPNAKIIVQRKKRIPVHSADDAQVRARNRVEEYSKMGKKTTESLFTTAALWRMCVEQTTYRYIPNNGRYRSSKIENKLDRDGKLARTIRSMEKLSPEQRQLQREIQRELRQEFEMQQKMERQAERNRQRAVEQRNMEQRRLDSRGNARSERIEIKKPAKDPLFHRRIKTPVELPPINVPLMGRAVNDQFVDSFHVRLNNLEEEMKRDQFLLKKKQQEYADDNMALTTSQVFRTQSDPAQVSSGPKHAHYMDFSGMPLFTEPVTEECLSVKPAISNHTSTKTSARDDFESMGDSIQTGRSMRTPRDEETMRNVLIKYTTNPAGIPKYTASVSVSTAAAAAAAAAAVAAQSGNTSVNSSTDQMVLKQRPNGQLTSNASKAPLRKDQSLHAREYLVSTHSAPPSSVATHNTFKYTTARTNRKLVANGVYKQDDPPVIVAEGLFSRNKPGGATENIQVTVTKRKREKSQESLPAGFIPGVAGKNCEVSQHT